MNGYTCTANLSLHGRGGKGGDREQFWHLHGSCWGLGDRHWHLKEGYCLPVSLSPSPHLQQEQGNQPTALLKVTSCCLDYPPSPTTSTFLGNQSLSKSLPFFSA
ncbi:Eukaryotic Translation Initiation Factor 4 Gamma 3 [Manis pentadactyla]|nr:Eukaryotic Translation Initiation Factor 4 Gamma 3 [Manis pentadactyla]